MVVRTYIVSHPLFQGFVFTMNVETTTTNSDIVANLIQKLTHTFHTLGFILLQKILDKTTFHVHTRSDQPLYICGRLCDDSVDTLLNYV